MTADPFANAEYPRGRGDVPRDGWDRPMLMPRGQRFRVPYTASSTLADFISNTRGLQKWRERYLARGLGMSPDLAEAAAAESYTTGFGEKDEGANKISGRRLDDIIQRALDRVQVHERADWGTAVHSLTEPARHGDYIPPRMKLDVESWNRAMRGIEIVDTEVFVACDELMTGGTLDHIVRVPGLAGLVILDKKTGRRWPGKSSVQLATYANGEPYDIYTDERLTFEEKYGEPVNLSIGLYGDIPAQQGETRIIPLDLMKGMRAARLATQVREWQKQADEFGEPLDTDALSRRQAEIDLRAVAGNRAEMRKVRDRYADVWTDELQQLGKSLIDNSVPVR